MAIEAHPKNTMAKPSRWSRYPRSSKQRLISSHTSAPSARSKKVTWKGTQLYGVPVMLNGQKHGLVVPEDGRLIAVRQNDDEDDA